MRCPAIVLFAALLAATAVSTPDLRFDVATFCCSCSYPDRFCQTHFDHLNFFGTNGHYVAMGSDAHRVEIEGNGNVLAVYHNDLNTNWTSKTATQKADEIHQYVLDRFTANGAAPQWVIINEISAGTWPGNQTYRTWVHDVAHRLRITYGYEVVLFSPFPNPGANSADWQLVTHDAYIGIENYLSGEEIKAQGFSVAWCQAQYQSSMNSYEARGVAWNRLFLGEDFAQTVAGTGYGRSGVAAAEWDAAVIARSTAARNVGFAGFLSYAWGKNNMGAPDSDLTHFEDIYAAQTLPGTPTAGVNLWHLY